MSTTPEEDLIRSLIYDHVTGVLTWAPGTKLAGNVAGYVTKRGHLVVSRKGVLYQAHRIAWLLYYGSWPTAGIDHIDGNPGHNWITNLRDATQQVNNMNKCLRRDSSTKVTGVSWCKLAKRWRAYISINKKPVRIGYFDDFDAAVAARKAAEMLHGYHPNHGRY